MSQEHQAASRRKRARSAGADAGADDGAGRAIFFERDNVLVVRDPAVFGPGRESFCHRLADALSRQEGVQRVELGLWSGTCRVEFAAGLVSQAEMAQRFAESVHGALAPGADAAEPEAPAPAVASGLRRVWYLALAGGSFAMTIVGLIVPGIPTVPFLLATSYYLVRSSPALNRRLRRSRFFGPIFEDLQLHGGLRPRNKLKLLGLTAVLAGGLLLIFGIPAGLLLIVVVASLAVSVYAVLRIPGIPGGAEPAAQPALAGSAG
jgi:uncharacterized membrane protein YbaN (DUF454 family)